MLSLPSELALRVFSPLDWGRTDPSSTVSEYSPALAPIVHASHPATAVAVESHFFHT